MTFGNNDVEDFVYWFATVYSGGKEVVSRQYVPVDRLMMLNMDESNANLNCVLILVYIYCSKYL